MSESLKVKCKAKKLFKVWLDREEEWPADDEPDPDLVYMSANGMGAVAEMAIDEILADGIERCEPTLVIVSDGTSYRRYTFRTAPRLEDEEEITLAWLRNQEER